MIAVEEALVSILLQDIAVSQLVGDRIDPQQSAQSTTHPRMTYQRISTPRIRHLRGRSKLAYPRIQVNCFALSYAEAKSLALAVLNALDTPDKYHQTFAGWFINGMLVEEEIDHYAPSQHGSDVGVHWVSLDVIIWHEEI